MSATATTDGLLDIDGLAGMLGVSERFVRRLVEERRIPFLKGAMCGSSPPRSSRGSGRAESSRLGRSTSQTHVADEQVANLRAEAPSARRRHCTFADLVARHAGTPFTARWDRGDVARKRTGTRTSSHPDAGVLQLVFESLELPDTDRQRLVIYLPADPTTASRLDRLAGRTPGALRSVRTA